MRATVVIIGAGPAGLSMSRCLTDLSVDHVLLERGRPANSWRTERWDSLRLLTPNWLGRLPGFEAPADDPDGYMTADRFADRLESYWASFRAPVAGGTNVRRVRSTDDGFVVETDQGRWSCRAVVDATGACSTPNVPSIAADLPRGITQLVPTKYRNPDQVSNGGVLVVGASASGVQLADELAAAGRDVTLAAGEHVRVPRRYRGMDIHWWMREIGLLDERHDEVDDLARARRLPSLQLVGSTDDRDVGLASLMDRGVRVVGRLAAADHDRLWFGGALANHTAAADLKMNRLLDRIDDHAVTVGLEREIGDPDRPAPTSLPNPINTAATNEFDTVIWATGFRPYHPWFEQDLLDRRGAVLHDGGVMRRPGMYVLGQPFLRRRTSSFVDGIGQDAVELSAHLADWLAVGAVAPRRRRTDDPRSRRRILAGAGAPAH